MRISKDPRDDGYAAYQAGTPWIVALDEFEVKDWITADDEAGTVLTYARGENGGPIRDPGSLAFVTETRTGAVTIGHP